MNIGNIIRLRRITLGFTQEELAKKLGYKSKSTINKIEMNVNAIPLSKVVEFAEILETTPSHLMGWEEKSQFEKRYSLEGLQSFNLKDAPTYSKEDLLALGEYQKLQKRFDNEQDKSLGERLKEIRKKNNLSLVEVAAKAELSISDLKKFENSKYYPGREVIGALFDLYNIQLQPFFEEGIIFSKTESETYKRNQRILDEYQRLSLSDDPKAKRDKLLVDSLLGLDVLEND
jgi:transcriptional regulator with XRE-family HTH domain